MGSGLAERGVRRVPDHRSGEASLGPLHPGAAILGGATAPGKDVRTFTRARVGLSMVSRYVSYHPPSNVGMTMVTGPWFFDQFGGGWRFTADGAGRGRRTTPDVVVVRTSRTAAGLGQWAKPARDDGHIGRSS